MHVLCSATRHLTFAPDCEPGDFKILLLWWDASQYPHVQSIWSNWPSSSHMSFSCEITSTYYSHIELSEMNANTDIVCFIHLSHLY